MPYTNVSGSAAVVVSYPPPKGSPHAILLNLGGQPAWVGQAGVSSATGLLLAPGSKANLWNAGGTIYGIAGFNQVAPFGTTNASTTIGGTVLTVASGGTAFGTGATIVVEPGSPRQEIAVVNTSNAGTVTTTAAFTFGHASSVVFSAINPLATTVKAERGTA